jgi:hypothetical protein
MTLRRVVRPVGTTIAAPGRGVSGAVFSNVAGELAFEAPLQG